MFSYSELVPVLESCGLGVKSLSVPLKAIESLCVIADIFYRHSNLFYLKGEN